MYLKKETKLKSQTRHVQTSNRPKTVLNHKRANQPLTVRDRFEATRLIEADEPKYFVEKLASSYGLTPFINSTKYSAAPNINASSLPAYKRHSVIALQKVDTQTRVSGGGDGGGGGGFAVNSRFSTILTTCRQPNFCSLLASVVKITLSRRKNLDPTRPPTWR